MAEKQCYGIHLRRKDGATEGYTCWAENLTQAWIEAGTYMATGKYKFVECVVLPPKPPPPRTEPLDADEFYGL